MNNIKENAQAIVSECERQERITETIKEMRDKDSTVIKFVYYQSGCKRNSLDASIRDCDIPKEKLREIQDFAISILENHRT